MHASLHHVAGIILVRTDGAVLAQHRDERRGISWPGRWACPGGAVEGSESCEAAARRELVEETGYIADAIYELVHDDPYTRYNGETALRHTYWSLYDGTQKIVCREGQEMRFLFPHDFIARTFTPGHENLFRLALDQASTFGFTHS